MRRSINRFHDWTRYELHLASWLVSWAIPRVTSRERRKAFARSHVLITEAIEARNAEMIARWNNGMRPSIGRDPKHVDHLLSLIHRATAAQLRDLPEQFR